VPDTRRASSPVTFVGVLLLLFGIGLWGLYRVAAGREDHAFAPDAIAPTEVHVTAGMSYSIAIRGGVPTETKAGLDPGALHCQYTPRGGSPAELTIVAEQTDTKATNQVASFTAPVSGSIHIECPGLAAVFVDDADDASGDLSGVLLVAATISLTAGVGLTLSALRGRPAPASTAASTADDPSARAPY
jgi:hypothetical protein